MYFSSAVVDNEDYTNEIMPSHDGTSTITGNTGNGYARITLISLD